MLQWALDIELQLIVELVREFYFKTAEEAFQDFNSTFVNDEG